MNINGTSTDGLGTGTIVLMHGIDGTRTAGVRTNTNSSTHGSHRFVTHSISPKVSRIVWTRLFANVFFVWLSGLDAHKGVACAPQLCDSVVTHDRQSATGIAEAEFVRQPFSGGGGG